MGQYSLLLHTVKDYNLFRRNRHNRKAVGLYINKKKLSCIEIKGLDYQYCVPGLCKNKRGKEQKSYASLGQIKDTDKTFLHQIANLSKRHMTVIMRGLIIL